VVLRVVRQLPDPVEQDHYLGKLAELLSVNKDALVTKLSSVPDETQPVRRRAVQPAAEIVDRDALERARTEEHLVALTLMQPKLRTYLYPLDPNMFTNIQTREVFEFLRAKPDYDGTDKQAVQKFAEYAKIITLVYETLYQDLGVLELAYEAKRLQDKLIAQYVRAEKQHLITRLQSAEPKETDALMRRVLELDELLRTNLTKEEQ